MMVLVLRVQPLRANQLTFLLLIIQSSFNYTVGSVGTDMKLQVLTHFHVNVESIPGCAVSTWVFN